MAEAVEVNKQSLKNFFELYERNWGDSPEFGVKLQEKDFWKIFRSGDSKLYFIEEDGRRIGTFGINPERSPLKKAKKFLLYPVSSVIFPSNENSIGFLTIDPKYRRKPKLFLRIWELMERTAMENGIKNARVFLWKENPNWRSPLERGLRKRGFGGYSSRDADTRKNELANRFLTVMWYARNSRRVALNAVRRFFGKQEKPAEPKRYTHLLTKQLRK